MDQHFRDRLRGIHTALVTPFLTNGDVDENGFRNLLIRQKNDGVHGVVLAGSTGESPTLTVKERILLIKIAKEILGSEHLVIAGAGSNSTHHACELQKIMQDAGADATLQVVPYYNKPTQPGLVAHFSAIAKNASIPIIAYNAFGRTGIDIVPETMAMIAEQNPQIVALKDAHPSMERMIDMIRMTRDVRPEFLFFTGEDSNFLPFLAIGADGNISVLSHIAAPEMLTLYRCFQQGELTYAQKIASRLNGLCKLLFSHTNPIPVKTILSAMGIIENHFRLPLMGLNDAEQKTLIDGCRSFDFIKNFKNTGILS